MKRSQRLHIAVFVIAALVAGPVGPIEGADTDALAANTVAQRALMAWQSLDAKGFIPLAHPDLQSDIGGASSNFLFCTSRDGV